MDEKGGKQPAFLFFPGDYLRDAGVSCVSLAAQGLWMRILCYMHQSDRRGFFCSPAGRAYTMAQVARIVGGITPGEAEAMIGELLDAGVCSVDGEGVLYSRRMVRDAEISAVRAEAGKKGAESPKRVRAGAGEQQNASKTPANEQQNASKQAAHACDAGAHSFSFSSSVSSSCSEESIWVGGSSGEGCGEGSSGEEPSPAQAQPGPVTQRPSAQVPGPAQPAAVCAARGGGGSSAQPGPAQPPRSASPVPGPAQPSRVGVVRGLGPVAPHPGANGGGGVLPAGPKIIDCVAAGGVSQVAAGVDTPGADFADYGAGAGEPEEPRDPECPPPWASPEEWGVACAMADWVEGEETGDEVRGRGGEVRAVCAARLVQDCGRGQVIKLSLENVVETVRALTVGKMWQVDSRLAAILKDLQFHADGIYPSERTRTGTGEMASRIDRAFGILNALRGGSLRQRLQEGPKGLATAEEVMPGLLASIDAGRGRGGVPPSGKGSRWSRSRNGSGGGH